MYMIPKYWEPDGWKSIFLKDEDEGLLTKGGYSGINIDELEVLGKELHHRICFHNISSFLFFLLISNLNQTQVIDL